MKLIAFLVFFIGVANSVSNAQSYAPVSENPSIGLLIQDKNHVAAKNGAAIAVTLANRKGGLKGRSFNLITKSMEGPWGTGSKQAVDLIFENEVWALLGSHDGRNAHLVEQAATKAQVVFLSAWSSDPTLAHAFVPWFFNAVPDDKKQAELLIKAIYSSSARDQIAVIADESYDAQMALKNFYTCLSSSGKQKPTEYKLESFRDLNVLSQEIFNKKLQEIILFCRSSAALKIIRAIHARNYGSKLYGSLMILNEDELSEQELKEIMNLVNIPAMESKSSDFQKFAMEYEKVYGKKPGMVAACAYDGANVLISAIRSCNSSQRDMIQEALSKMTYQGVTGTIGFDKYGSRK